jgi:outer membrane receptor protein involved in Fe transport
MVSYQVPKVEVGINAYFRSLSGGRYGPVQAQVSYVAYLEPRGAHELPRQNILDLRIEKVFRRGQDRIGLFADITNAFNASAVTWVAQNARAYERPLELMNPRQVVLGARWSF